MKEHDTRPEVKMASSLFLDEFSKFTLDEFLKLHKEEELIRLAYRARKARKLWIEDIILAEIRDRTPE